MMMLEVLYPITAIAFAVYSIWHLNRTGDALPVLVFCISYFLLFFVGAIGMHIDPEGYFRDWIVSIGVQETYLSKEKLRLHIASISSPFIMVPAGAIIGQRLLKMQIWRFTPDQMSWVILSLPLLGFGLGLFFGFVSLLLVFGIFVFRESGETANPFESTNRPVLLAYCLFWGIAAIELARHHALGSFLNFIIHFDLQTQLMELRGALTTQMPFWFWAISYTILPTICAVYLLSLPPKSKLWLKTLIITSTAWIIFGNFFKGPVVFFLLYLTFCFGSREPRRLLRLTLITLCSGFVLISSFYLTVSSMAGDTLEVGKLIQHYFYRLGTNQFYYISVFPDVRPFFSPDLSTFQIPDAQVVYQFMYPMDALNPAGSTGGPYICNAFAQGGMLPVVVYGILGGCILQIFWGFSRRMSGALGTALQGRIVFLGFMFSQLAFRDLLFSGWGLLWALVAAALLQILNRHPFREGPIRPA